jgi:DNA ligase-associated metallophosphoesterase
MSGFRVNGERLLPDISGALYWPATATLIIADLHLEKGSAFAARGQLLPPYDSVASLERLADAAQRLRPKRVISLGDSFHDGKAGTRMAAPTAGFLVELTAAFQWIWIVGNHDPEPPDGFGGKILPELKEGPNRVTCPAKSRVTFTLAPTSP